MTQEKLLQRLEADAESYRRGREHVAALAAEHNADLHRWAVRRGRRQRAAALAAAATLVAASFLVPHRSDTFVSGDLQCCTAQACSRITVIMATI